KTGSHPPAQSPRAPAAPPDVSAPGRSPSAAHTARPRAPPAPAAPPTAPPATPAAPPVHPAAPTRESRSYHSPPHPPRLPPRPHTSIVTPAKAGVQGSRRVVTLDSRFRGNDSVEGRGAKQQRIEFHI